MAWVPELNFNHLPQYTMNLGSAIKKAREARKVNLEDLAQQVGTTAEFLRQVEEGEVSPVAELRAAICVRLDIAVPALSFLALEEVDVPEHKRPAFLELAGPMRSLIEDLFLVG